MVENLLELCINLGGFFREWSHTGLLFNCKIIVSSKQICRMQINFYFLFYLQKMASCHVKSKINCVNRSFGTRLTSIILIIQTEISSKRYSFRSILLIPAIRFILVEWVGDRKRQLYGLLKIMILKVMIQILSYEYPHFGRRNFIARDVFIAFPIISCCC